MRRVLLILLFLCAAFDVRADDQLRAVQQQLKDQGFFYGDVDGQAGAETSAAIRRFQIRNGLQVTGSVNLETLSALKVPGGAPAQPAQRAQPAQPVPDSQSQNPDVSNSDREFLHSTNPAPSVAPAAPSHRYVGVATAAPTEVSLAGYFRTFYAQTPYASAPLEVQVETLRRAQSILVRYGTYQAPVDGQPGPETQRSLIVFQQANRLTTTARLDMDTLAVMRLLPGRGIFTPQTPVQTPYGAALRGVWVH